MNEVRGRWVDDVGFEEDGASPAEGREAQERQSSLETLLDIIYVGRPGRTRPPMSRRVIAELERRAAHERDERRRTASTC